MPLSLPIEIKNDWKKAKGEKEWGDFLLEMCTQGQHKKGKKAFEEFRQLLSKMT